MFKQILLLTLAAGAGFSEVHTLTLQQAVTIALKDNPDLVLARLDEQKAVDSVRIAKDPFTPKVWAGSGLAKTYGYPSNIEGSAPAIVQARTDMALYNRAKSFELAKVRENARGAAIGTQSKSDDVAFQTASLFLDARQLARNMQSLKLEVESLRRVSGAVKLRVEEGREIELENKRIAVDLARAEQRADGSAGDLEMLQASLAVVLGFPAGDRVEALEGEPKQFEIPENEQAARELALENSKEIRRLQSQLQAKGFEVREYKSAFAPVVDVVAQYSLFDKGTYQDVATHFQRNNGQIGVSISIPLLIGSAVKGLRSQAETDILELRAQVNQTRNRIELDVQKNYKDLEKAGKQRDVAKLDLDYSREQVSVLLALLGEGRATQQRVDDARLAEQEKWIAFYEAQNVLEKARLNLLRQTGTLQAALR